jgi:hypothetical protein
MDKEKLVKAGLIWWLAPFGSIFALIYLFYDNIKGFLGI